MANIAPEAYTFSSGSNEENQLLKESQEKIRLSANARRQFEPTWKLCQHFLAGKQWVSMTGEGRDARVVSLAESNEFKDRVRITINVLTRYIWTALSKIVADDIMPSFTFLAESNEAKQYLNQANASWKYGYQQEIDGDEEVLQAVLKELTFGTAALRARYDFGAGPIVAEVPVVDGQPMTDQMQARAYMEQAFQQGVPVELRKIRSGALCWDDLGPTEMFPPPGIEHEEDFPWFGIGRAIDLDELGLLYPDKTEGLEEESLEMMDRLGSAKDESGTGAANDMGKLKNSTMFYSLFHRPTNEKPNGCVVHWTQDRLLDYVQTLPYERGGIKKAGIVFLKWHPVPNRFWSIGMVEPAIGPQFELNRAQSQFTELVDKNLGRAWVTKGTITDINRPQGTTMEIIELAPGASPPIESPGTQPGPWIREEIELMKQNISEVIGMGTASLGQAPRGITAYSAFAFMVEQDDRDLLVANQTLRRKLGELAHYSISDMRQYWGKEKHVTLAGPEDQMQTFVFNATQIPSEYMIIAKRTVGVPTAASAEIQKVFDIFDRSIGSGRPLPLDWLWDSLQQGRALELPKSQDATQRQKAELENMVLVHGQMVQPAPEDDDEMHVNVHVAGKASHQMVPGHEQVVQIFDMHIQMHIQNAQQKMQAATLATQQAAGHEGPKFENAAAGAGAAQPPIA